MGDGSPKSHGGSEKGMGTVVSVIVVGIFGFRLRDFVTKYLIYFGFRSLKLKPHIEVARDI